MENNNYKPFPEPLGLKKLIGPSFIILALGLGSGEVILWPYLSSNYGLGLIWGALLGITFQFFINMEIERYALVKGESVFVGLYRIFRWSAIWFIVSTFIGFGLPGIIAASAKVLAGVLGFTEFKWLAIGLLVVIGLILSLGRTVYGLMERLTKLIIFIGVPFIFILAIILSKSADWGLLAQGFIGKGDGYWFLPVGISLATFFGAFAYSGAGGNLNLTQSIYIKEKGYGMGVHAQKISGFFRNIKRQEEIRLSGHDFDPHPNNIALFKRWWKDINLEHFLVFWLIGFVSICLLMVLAFVTTFGFSENISGINFVIHEGLIIGQQLWPWAGSLFLIVVGILLFQTQLGIFDSTARIMSENMALTRLGHKGQGTINLSKIYFISVWLLVVFGSTLFLFNIYEPRTLIVFGAVLNAFSMFIHIALVNWMNYKVLPKACQPIWWRKAIILLAFIFFGIFSFITIGQLLFG
ncbi:MAG: Nramp family divalent metal transporter [Patescibacteria group bacterium]|jgi:hypothetical protein